VAKFQCLGSFECGNFLFFIFCIIFLKISNIEEEKKIEINYVWVV
jgi:hypothetical protein